jgi:hypothetical protein
MKKKRLDFLTLLGKVLVMTLISVAGVAALQGHDVLNATSEAFMWQVGMVALTLALSLAA